MNTKFFLFTLIGIFYFSLMPMNKQQVAWNVKATGYSFATAASAALFVYSLIEIPNRSPLDTFTSLVTGIAGMDYFGKQAYKNTIQAWKGKNLKIAYTEINNYIIQTSEKAIQDIMAIMKKVADSTYFDMDVDITPQDGSQKIPATLRVKAIPNPNLPTTEMWAEYLKQPVDEKLLEGEIK